MYKNIGINVAVGYEIYLMVIDIKYTKKDVTYSKKISLRAMEFALIMCSIMWTTTLLMIAWKELR